MTTIVHIVGQICLFGRSGELKGGPPGFTTRQGHGARAFALAGGRGARRAPPHRAHTPLPRHEPAPAAPASGRVRLPHRHVLLAG